MRSNPATRWEALLAGQHGVVTRAQATRTGLDPQVIDARLRRDRWQCLYRGVYATFTGPPPRLALLWAALLRGGPGAALSHYTAAELDRLTDQLSTAIHVSVSKNRRITAGERGPGVPAIVVHYSSRAGDACHPVRTPRRTRVEETALDLAQAASSADEAMSWLIRACARRLTTPELLATAMAARIRLRWRPDLIRALAEARDGIQSWLESRYVRNVERAHGLPRATRQACSRAGGRTRYLDNLYEGPGVAVELDGEAAHPAEARWLDIRRDNASATAGIITLRYGWPDITASPCRVAAEVAAVLQQRGWRGRPRACRPGCPAVASPGCEAIPEAGGTDGPARRGHRALISPGTAP